MAKGKRRTIEEQIEDYKLKIKQLEKKRDEQNAKKLAPPPITKDSPGVAELGEHLVKVAKDNNAPVADLIVVLSKLKRTGLKFSN
jgi:hypothetical protein